MFIHRVFQSDLDIDPNIPVIQCCELLGNTEKTNGKKRCTSDLFHIICPYHCDPLYADLDLSARMPQSSAFEGPSISHTCPCTIDVFYYQSQIAYVHLNVVIMQLEEKVIKSLQKYRRSSSHLFQ